VNAANDRPGRTVERAIVRLDGPETARAFDDIVTEEPLEIRLRAGGATQTLAITMRTPGNDFELAAGFLFGEGIVRNARDIAGMSYCVDPEIDAEQQYNIVNVDLASPQLPDASRFERHFTMNSSCGVCGRANLDALRDAGIAPVDDDARFAREAIFAVPGRMRDAQRVFAATGGLHAAALFSTDGTVIALREDVGRHNAVDKLHGAFLMKGAMPLGGYGLFVSGRASFEILQKAAVARIPLVCAVSAPSSLAVELARSFQITLAGFVRGTRANVYTVPERIT
jgi:FdhD protein